MIYVPNADEARCAWLIAGVRNGMNGGQTNLPVECMGEHERRLQHYRACLSEIAVARYTNLCWTGLGIGARGCRDVGGIIEVRSTAAEGRGLIWRGKDGTEDVPMVLVWVDGARRCTMTGWAMLSEVRERGKEVGGEKPFRLLSPDLLRPMDGLLEFVSRAPRGGGALLLTATSLPLGQRGRCSPAAAWPAGMATADALAA